MNGLLMLINRKIRNNKKRMIMTIAALALGVCVLIALQISIKQTKSTFVDNINSEISNADLVMKNVSDEFIKDDISFLDTLECVEDYIPRVETKALHYRGEDTYYLNLYGINVNKEQKTKSLILKEGSLPLEGEVLITDKLVNVGYSIGDEIELETSYGGINYKISGIVKEKGVASTQNGIVCVIDSQTMSNLIESNRYTSINIILKNSLEQSKNKELIKEYLSEGTIIEATANKDDYYLETLEGFFLGLNIMGVISVIAGGFIIYNTINKLVIDETKEIAILKVMGGTDKTVLAFVVFQTLFFALVGIVIGLFSGILLSGAVSSIVMASAIGETYQGIMNINYKDILWVLLFAFGVTLVSGIVPAIKAAKINIIEGLAIVKYKAEYSMKLISGLIILACISLIITILHGVDSKSGALVLIIEVLLISYLILFFIIKPFAKLFTSLIRGKKILFAKDIVLKNIVGNIPRNVNTIFSSALCIAMAIAIMGLTGGFKSSLNSWIDSMADGDIVGYSRIGVSEEIIKSIENVDGIKDVEGEYSTYNYDDKYNLEYEVDNLIIQKFKNESFKKHINKSEDDYMNSFKSGNGIIITSLLAEKFDKDLGDNLILAGENGEISVRIIAIMDSFKDSEYKIYINSEKFKSIYPSKTLRYFIIFKEENADIKDINSSLKKGQYDNIEFTLMSDEIEAKKISIGDSLFMAFYVLIVISFIVSGISLTNSINISTLEKMYQFAILKSIGMQEKMMKKILYIQGIVLGGFIALIGVSMGLGIQYIGIKLTTIVTGWEISYVLKGVPIILIMLIAIVISIISCINSASKVYKIDTVEIINKGEA